MGLATRGRYLGWGRFTEIVGGELIGFRQPDRDGCVDTDDPGEIEEVKDGDQKDGNLRDGYDGAHDGLDECLPEMARAPLFDTNESEYARFRHWLLACGDIAVVNRFVDQSDYQKPAQSS